MAKSEADGVVLPADGGAVAVEKTEKKIVRRARPDEVGGNGNGGAPGLPMCPLLPNQSPYMGVKIFKGGGSKGAHVVTVNGPEMESLDENYLRDTYAAEWGAGIYYLQGINAKGQPVPNENTTVNLSKPGSPTANGPAQSDSLAAIMQAQLAESRAAQTRTHELLVAMIAKPADTGISTVLAAAITALGNMGSKGGGVDPTIAALLTDSQSRAAAAEVSRNAMIERLLDKPSTPTDTLGVAERASTAIVNMAESVASSMAAGKSDVRTEVAREGIKTIRELGGEALQLLGWKRAHQQPSTPTPPAPPKKAIFKIAPVTPPAQPTNGMTPPAAAPTPEATGTAAPTPTPEPKQPEATVDETQVTEADALKQIDEAVLDPNGTAEDVAGLFVYHAEQTGAFPKAIIGPLANMSEDELRPWPKRLGMPHWSDEPHFTKIKAAMEVLREYVNAKIAEEQRQLAVAAAQGDAQAVHG